MTYDHRLGHLECIQNADDIICKCLHTLLDKRIRRPSSARIVENDASKAAGDQSLGDGMVVVLARSQTVHQDERLQSFPFRFEVGIMDLLVAKA